MKITDDRFMIGVIIVAVAVLALLLLVFVTGHLGH